MACMDLVTVRQAFFCVCPGIPKEAGTGCYPYEAAINLVYLAFKYDQAFCLYAYYQCPSKQPEEYYP